ncbi:hypothetical protein [Hafnia paralvei]|uniref:hypothetical protein n=1 Tax=Hafnia paralvei TaxID=546367 RepID=UPI003C2AAE5E
MKKLIPIRWLILAVAIFYSASGMAQTFLEAKDVIGLKIEKSDDKKGEILNISGLSSHSALAVKNMESKIIDNHILSVKIALTMAGSGTSGRFDYTVNLPKEINSVEFGNERQVIWRREVAAK